LKAASRAAGVRTQVGEVRPGGPPPAPAPQTPSPPPRTTPMAPRPPRIRARQGGPQGPPRPRPATGSRRAGGALPSGAPRMCTAAGIHGDQVAGMQPAILGERLGRLSGHAVVAAGQHRVASSSSPRPPGPTSRPASSTTRAWLITPSTGCWRTAPRVPNGRVPGGQISPYGLSDIA